MLEAVRNLLKELSAILSALRRAGNAAVSSTVIERIQEYAVTWSANARPGLAAIGVPKEVLERADELTYKLARLTSGSVNQKKLFAALGAVWKVLHEQVLLEVARIPPAFRPRWLYQQQRPRLCFQKFLTCQTSWFPVQFKDFRNRSRNS